MSSQKGEPQYVELYVQYNNRHLTFARSAVAAIAGSAAGVLGLSGWKGFAFYGIVALTSSLALFVRCQFRPDLYFKKEREIWMEGVFGGLLSFVLFHTLMYGIVHLYQ
ncbi:uncharacterized protein VTP21DRAFT_1275 [Calcarisporiella thermophila]|uniref:uncharacterized protein n=1 Tax=Calcarisporiella thermophila TaxID=911321 RepID=UPI0037440B5E